MPGLFPVFHTGVLHPKLGLYKVSCPYPVAGLKHESYSDSDSALASASAAAAAALRSRITR